MLDNQRLGVQRSECMVLLRAVAGTGRASRWSRAAQSWMGHGPALLLYTLALMTEWQRRGLPDNMPLPVGREGAEHWGIPQEWGLEESPEIPEWVGWEPLHASHRALLLKKDPAWYAQFCWEETPRNMIVWPGRLPEPGDYLVREGHDPVLVVEMHPGEIECTLDGRTLVVPTTEVRRRVWRRAVGDFN